MARQQDEAHEIAERVGERANLGRQTTFGAAYGLALSPPFAPWPWRWTLTMVASIMAYSMSGSSEQASKEPDEYVALDPIAVALEDRVPLAEDLRKVAPRTARPNNPSDCLDKETVVAAAAPGICRLSQTMWLHLRPLRVSQYQSLHPKLESRTSPDWNPESQQALVRVT